MGSDLQILNLDDLSAVDHRLGVEGAFDLRAVAGLPLDLVPFGVPDRVPPIDSSGTGAGARKPQRSRDSNRSGPHGRGCGSAAA